MVILNKYIIIDIGIILVYWGWVDMYIKPWNEKIKKLRDIILNESEFEESIKLCLELHSMVHTSEMSGRNLETFEDDLWEGLDEDTFKTAKKNEGRTIAYNLWHISRIEDITMNILVAGDKQVFNTDSWKERINTNIIDTGNAMSENEIIVFSQNINMQELKNYRIAVGRRTIEIIKLLKPHDMKRKFEKDSLERILDEGAVAKAEGSKWLIDFWGRKNVSGIILMPVTRHQVVHINEAISAKNKHNVNENNYHLHSNYNMLL